MRTCLMASAVLIPVLLPQPSAGDLLRWRNNTFRYNAPMYTLAYTKAAAKILAKMPADYRLHLSQALRAVAADPSAHGGDWKPLRGTPPMGVGDRAGKAIFDMPSPQLSPSGSGSFVSLYQRGTL